MKPVKPTAVSGTYGISGAVLLATVLVFLFWESLVPGYVHFANDGPLGQQMTAWSRLPGIMTGAWADLNDIGSFPGGASPNVDTFLRWALGPVGFAKFLPPVALFILGLGAWTFFRQLRLTPLAATLGALAAMLNSTYFSGACWGVATQEIAVGMIFFALALIVSVSPATPVLDRWARIALAGFAVGMNVMEGADIGALFSLFVAGFVIYQAFVATEGGVVMKLARGTGRVVLIAVCAAFISAYALSSLIGTQIKGIVGMQQDAETKARRWNEATLWSLPKLEALGLFVPGLFGYRMDTPNNMEMFKDGFEGGNYWGAMGRDPAWYRYFENGGKGPQPPGSLRFSGGGNYTGVLVALAALWAAFQAFRKGNSVFTPAERKLLWFWTGVAILSLLLAFGRFAPFYQILYALPYFSTMRNPGKFLGFFSFAMPVLFAYGIHGLNRRYLEIPLANAANLNARLKSWWAKADLFDKRWILGCLAAIGASLAGWLIYSLSRHSLEQYLDTVQLGGELAPRIAGFSIRQAGWFILFLTVSVAVLALILSGTLAGRRAKGAGILLGLVLVADLGRANLPWIVYWNYPEKYETSGPNPIIQFLAQKPYEHRVVIFPERILAAFQVPEQVSQAEAQVSRLYDIEWNQHLFPYYNIQTLDLIQRPRTPEDIDAYEKALAIRSIETLRNLSRQWQLTNTRYVLGFVGLLNLLNPHFDPGQERFRIAERFDIVLKPGITRFTQWQDLTAQTSTNGIYALFEFTGALPRAKLYANWQRAEDDPAAREALSKARLSPEDLASLKQLGTNDFLTLKGLASPSFDPAQTVLLASPVPAPPNTAGAATNAGTVEFSSYASKDIKLHALATAPAVLMLNDKYDPNWQVWVDGKRADLLRCNFIMRGVYLTPGPHDVEFLFKPGTRDLYVSLAATALALLLLGFVVFSKKPPARDPVQLGALANPNAPAKSSRAGSK